MGQDEIVVERSWRSGVEIVARVNWSQIARVRRAMGLSDMTLGTPFLPRQGRQSGALRLVPPDGRRAA